MKILYILSGTELGTFYRALFWAKFLSKRDHKITLICAHPQPSYALFKVKYVDGIKIINLFRTYQRWDFIGFLVRALIIFFFCIFHKADIVHAFVVWQPPSMSAIFVAKALRVLGLRKWVVLADWDDWWGEGGISEEHGYLLRRSITFFEKQMPKFADGVTVVGERLMERAISAGIQKDKIYIVPNGSDVEKIEVMDNVVAKTHLGFANHKYILTYIGHSHLPQFFKMMFSALEKTIEHKIDVILLIAGAVPIEYKASISDTIKSKVFFLGRQPQENIPFILGASDILLLPMVANVEEESRWPIRFGDYLASGRAIVASAVGEVRNVIEKEGCGLLARPDDPEDFAQKILSLLESRELRQRFGQRARQVARTHSWQRIVSDLEKIYENLTNQVS